MKTTAKWRGWDDCWLWVNLETSPASTGSRWCRPTVPGLVLMLLVHQWDWGRRGTDEHLCRAFPMPYSKGNFTEEFGNVTERFTILDGNRWNRWTCTETVIKQKNIIWYIAYVHKQNIIMDHSWWMRLGDMLCSSLACCIFDRDTVTSQILGTTLIFSQVKIRF